MFVSPFCTHYARSVNNIQDTTLAECELGAFKSPKGELLQLLFVRCPNGNLCQIFSIWPLLRLSAGPKPYCGIDVAQFCLGVSNSTIYPGTDDKA